MRVLVAGRVGFCDGVKHAIRLARDGAARLGPLRSDGPLIHNSHAMRLLEIHNVVRDGEPDGGTRGGLLVRAHGIPPDARRQRREEGWSLVDATCPRVARNQRLAREAAAAGLSVVIAGDPGHAEVGAVAGSAGADCRVISGTDEAERLEPDKPFLFMAQTTFDAARFRDMADILRRRHPGCRITDTICPATHERQAEARRLARLADALVVVGGRQSANTRHLAEAGNEAGKRVFLVESAEELHPGDFAAIRTVAVTAGASTPGWVTQEVINRLRFMGSAKPAALAIRLIHRLAESRLATALAAAGLALAAGLFLTRNLDFPLAAAGMCYVFFAHTINRRVPSFPPAKRLNLTDAFYQARRSLLLIPAWLAAALSLGLAARRGSEILALFLAAVCATIGHALLRNRVPGGWTIPDALPGFRNWAMAGGWSLILAGPFIPEAEGGFAGIGAMAYIFLLCLGTTLTRDLHDIASDRLLGIDTLPVRIGPDRSRRLAGAGLALAAAIAFAAAAGEALAGGGPSPRLFFLMALGVVPMAGARLLELATGAAWRDAVLLQAGLDSLGALAGAAAVAAGAAS